MFCAVEITICVGPSRVDCRQLSLNQNGRRAALGWALCLPASDGALIYAEAKTKLGLAFSHQFSGVANQRCAIHSVTMRNE
jgi:hypothetical protein